MSEQDPIKAAEQRGYARGYIAGRKRADRDEQEQERLEKREEFRRQAFLAALPSCILAQGWKRGDVAITSAKGRTRLAWEFADEAMKGTMF